MAKQYRPRGFRVRLYDEVLRLREQGLSYNKIINEIEKMHGERLSTATISEWLRGIHSPYNGRRFPSIEFLKPSPELSYVIGTVLGDGTVVISEKRRKGYNESFIELAVKDLEFAEEFSRCLEVVLNRKLQPRYNKSHYRYVVRIRDKTLFELLHGWQNSLEKIKPYIEYSEECKAKFLKGLFDSEGTYDKYNHLRLYNSNLGLILYAIKLLNELGIETSGPHLKTRKGTIIFQKHYSKSYKTDKDYYYLHIIRGSFLTFYKKIGFSIPRKKKRLEECLQRKGLV